VFRTSNFRNYPKLEDENKVNNGSSSSINMNLPYLNDTPSHVSNDDTLLFNSFLNNENVDALDTHVLNEHTYCVPKNRSVISLSFLNVNGLTSKLLLSEFDYFIKQYGICCSAGSKLDEIVLIGKNVNVNLEVWVCLSNIYV
jgi:hypothetical protein